MGKPHSKEEEIIIAQNGANQSDLTNMENHIKLCGIAIFILGGLLLGVLICKCYMHLRSSATGLIQGAMAKSIQKCQENQGANIV